MKTQTEHKSRQAGGHIGKRVRALQLVLLTLAVVASVPASAYAEDCNNNGVPNEIDVDVAAGVFFDAVAYTAGIEPFSLALGDLDGDGFQDMVTANNQTDSISILFNHQDGTFAIPVSYNVGNAPRSVAIGDLDGDFDLDLVVANASDNNVSILLNDGSGAFSNAVQYATGIAPVAVAIADLDADGDLDLAAVCRGPDAVSILLNSGSGTFANGGSYPAGRDPTAIAIDDLDGDGDPDLAVVNNFGIFSSNNGVTVLRNNGAGAFSQYGHYTTGSLPTSVVIGDLDGDGDRDLAVTNSYGGDRDVSVLLNNGSAMFSLGGEYGVGFVPNSIAIHDLDNDGDLDLVTANNHHSLHDISLLFNNGNATFAPDVRYDAGSQPYCVAIGDLDGDGDPDIAVANQESGDVSVLLRLNADCNDNGIPDDCDIAGITSHDCNANGVPDECEIATGFDQDCNLNGIPDSCELAMGTADDCDANGVLDGCEITGDPGLDCNDNAILDRCEIPAPEALFEPDAYYSIVGIATKVTHGDFDRDGHIDLAAANSNNTVSVLLNNNDGTFANEAAYGVGVSPSSIAAANLDGDNYLDLVLTNQATQDLSVLLNKGDGTFADAVLYGLGPSPRAVAAGDLDGDGDLDIVAANHNDDTVSILLNNGDGTFAGQVSYGTGDGPVDVAIGDLDGDDDLDLVVVNTLSDNVSVLHNTGDGTFADDVLYFVADAPSSVAIGDLDGDSDLDLAVANKGTGNLSVLRNNNNGTFANDVRFLAGHQPADVVLSDLDGDGDLDVVVADASSGAFPNLFSVTIRINDGNADFPDGYIYGNGEHSTDATLADLNADGIPDLVLAKSAVNSLAVMLHITGDCNGNGVPDECELDDNDCNDNGVPDECDPDRDGDGIPDSCDFDCVNTLLGDVDGSGVVDAADIANFALVLARPLVATNDESCAADVNGDGFLNGGDIEMFLSILLAP